MIRQKIRVCARTACGRGLAHIWPSFESRFFSRFRKSTSSVEVMRMMLSLQRGGGQLAVQECKLNDGSLLHHAARELEVLNIERESQSLESQ